MNPLLLDYIADKKILEIGGPSIILQFLYNSAKSISLLNHKESIEYFSISLARFTAHKESGEITVIKCCTTTKVL